MNRGRFSIVYSSNKGRGEQRMRRQRGQRPGRRFGKQLLVTLTCGVLVYAVFSMAQFIVPGGGRQESGLTAEASAEGWPPAAGRSSAEAAESGPDPSIALAAAAGSASVAAAAPAEGDLLPGEGSLALPEASAPDASTDEAQRAEPEDAAAPALRAALTFDDGPDGKYTPIVLDILQTYGVKATFFVVGKQAERYPEVLLRIQAEGHEIGSHSYAHTNMEKLTPEQIAEDLNKTDEAIAAVTGEAPALFRAPYGAVPKKLKAVLESSDRELVQWNVDPRDWAGTPKDEIVDEVTKTVKPNGVILLHSFGGKNANLDHTIEALPVIIERLHEAGYTLGTVSDLEDDRV